MSSTFYYTYDSSQRMTLRHSEAFVDTTKREASYFSYNQRDQVIRLANEKGASPDALRTFTYNGQGTLVFGQDGTATPSYFAWDGSRMVLENYAGNSTRARWGRGGQVLETVAPDLTRANPVQEQWGRTGKLVGPATNQYFYNVSGEREAATQPLGSTIPTQNRIQAGPDPSFIRLGTTLESYIDPQGRVCLPSQNVFACGDDPRIPNPPILAQQSPDDPIVEVGADPENGIHAKTESGQLLKGSEVLFPRLTRPPFDLPPGTVDTPLAEVAFAQISVGCPGKSISKVYWEQRLDASSCIDIEVMIGEVTHRTEERTFSGGEKGSRGSEVVPDEVYEATLEVRERCNVVYQKWAEKTTDYDCGGSWARFALTQRQKIGGPINAVTERTRAASVRTHRASAEESARYEASAKTDEDKRRVLGMPKPK